MEPTTTPTDTEIGDVLDEWNDACADMLAAGEDHDLSLQVICAYALNDDGWTGTGEPNCIDVAEGINGCLADTPPIPDGFTAVSTYLEFAGERDTSVVIGLPLKEPVATINGIAFYSYLSGEWVKVADATFQQEGTVGRRILSRYRRIWSFFGRTEQGERAYLALRALPRVFERRVLRSPYESLRPPSGGLRPQGDRVGRVVGIRRTTSPAPAHPRRLASRSYAGDVPFGAICVRSAGLRRRGWSLR